MNFENPNEILRHVFAEKRAKNPAYSTRALARDLGMSQAYVSLLLNDKRSMTVKQAARLCAILGLSSIDTQKFMNQVLEQSPENAKWVKRWKKEGKTFVRPKTFAELNLEQFQVISRWFHYAVTDLTQTKDFKPDPKWIAERLGITPIEAKDTLDRLVRVGLIEKTKDSYQKKTKYVKPGHFPKSELAARTHQREMMERASIAMEKTGDDDFARRSITSLTLPADMNKIEEAKALIEEFKERMAALVSHGDLTQVYQLNVQLFPLTQIETSKKKGKSV